MKVKGLDFLLEVAGAMQDVQFVIVGLQEPLLARFRRDAPVNVQVVPFVEQSMLLSYYRRARVYCQPSRSEGFPNSVCEAMLCECVPVGTDVGGMRTAFGDHGFIVTFGDRTGLVDALRAALQAPESRGHQAREYTAREFPLSRREEDS